MKEIPFFRSYLLDFHANKYYPHLAFVSWWTNKLVLHFLVVESDLKVSLGAMFLIPLSNG